MSRVRRFVHSGSIEGVFVPIRGEAQPRKRDLVSTELGDLNFSC
jgi:hypothetical protein